jgi:hypothetical protein
MLDKYKVEYMHRGGKPKEHTKVELRKSHHKLISEEVAAEVVEPEIIPEVVVPDVKEIVPEDLDIFQLKYIKTDVLGSEVQKRILDYMSIVYDDKKYEVQLIIKEI